MSCPDYPGPITFDDTRGTAYRRPTDVPPDIPMNPEATRTASLNDPNTAQGPHGSIYKRILRANYDTKVGTSEEQTLIGDTVTNVGRGNARNRPIILRTSPSASTAMPRRRSSPPPGPILGREWRIVDGDPVTKAFIPPTARLTNFLSLRNTDNVDGQNLNGGNLHMLHLVGRTNARCHECHNNVHSNVEAGNTLYVGLNDPTFV
ncbi:MAG: hypothetical protein MPW16_13805 [Candidatus Manganitrophus sp.]|nr:MAG: hypothetical protein MPW16_13805 [Candidatus Manganitrophus sp.]